jgi:hypothetical protein
MTAWAAAWILPAWAAQSQDPPEESLRKLARRCAEEIPWRFDAPPRPDPDKPVLLYVRCTDDVAGLDSARESIRADRISWNDDGFRKDLLFRAGPLSDRAVAEAISRRFIAVCVTYHFDSHGKGRGGVDWTTESGRIEEGELRLKGSGAWIQNIPYSGPPRRLKLSARVRTAGDGLARIRVIFNRKGDQVISETEAASGDWRRLTAELDPPEGCVSILFMPVFSGPGSASFDDLSLAPEDGPNLIRNGSIDSKEGADPLEPFGLSAKEVTAPALVVLKPSGAVKLDRLGVFSAPEVLRWLGEAPQPTALSGGDWREALEELSGRKDDESVFWRGWCLRMLGRYSEARDLWRSIVGESRYGKKAAACLLREPCLWLSESPRARAGRFDPARAARALAELQREDGSFADQNPKDWWAPAITAIAADALDRFREAEARDRAVRWLSEWTRSGKGGLDAFNAPYVALALLRLKARDAAARAVSRVVAAQQRDGSWTVYGPDRPTSFNAALCLLALAKARESGLEVGGEGVERGARRLEEMRRDGLFPYSTKAGHEWMTTEHGSIARDPLCELALSAAGREHRAASALERFGRWHEELRVPVKRYHGDFDRRGHGSYFFYFAYRHAAEAAGILPEPERRRVRDLIREALLASREIDGTFLDHYGYGRAYGTAQALVALDECGR